MQFVSGSKIPTFAAFTGGTSNVSAVPEPSTIALFGLGLIGIGFAARRRISP
jgi:hypothetical protein